MMTPDDALANITTAAFQEGRQAAEIVWRYAPAPIDPKWLEKVQDNVAEAVIEPYAANQYFAQLPHFLGAISLSAWDGFEGRWKELQQKGPRPLDRKFQRQGV